MPVESGILEGAGGINNLNIDNVLFFEKPKGNFKLTKKLAHDVLPQDVDVMSFTQKLLKASVSP